MRVRRYRKAWVLLLARAVQSVRSVFYRALSSNSIRGRPRRSQPVQCVGKGAVVIEDNVQIGFFPSPYFFSTYAYLEARSITAIVRIGSGTRINNNFTAIAEHSAIVIGRNCLIGTGVEIIDSDFHAISVAQRGGPRGESARPVEIGDDVFIGSNVRILKGVTIGARSTIANGAVVSSAIPSGVLAGGNPARVLREIA